MAAEKTRRSCAGERGIALVPLLALIVLIVVVWAFWEPMLAGVGTFLDNGKAPKKADAIVVLAGGWRGERVEAAAELKEKGYAGLVVVSGAMTLYGQNECALALTYLQSMGRGTEGFVCADSETNSTNEESDAVVDALRRRGVKSALIVSCDTHMRRAGRLWRQRAPDLELTFVSAKSKNFDLQRWYRTREGWKSVVMEWAKLVTSAAGV